VLRLSIVLRRKAGKGPNSVRIRGHEAVQQGNVTQLSPGWSGLEVSCLINGSPFMQSA
jgi:hypothetical protein